MQVTEITAEDGHDHDDYVGDSWCFALGSDGRFEDSFILLDSGSDEHVCPTSFVPRATTRQTDNKVRMRDAQGQTTKHDFQRDAKVKMQTEKGTSIAKATFEVTDVKVAIRSAGKLAQKNIEERLSPEGSYLAKMVGE